MAKIASRCMNRTPLHSATSRALKLPKGDGSKILGKSWCTNDGDAISCTRDCIDDLKGQVIWSKSSMNAIAGGRYCFFEVTGCRRGRAERWLGARGEIPDSATSTGSEFEVRAQFG